MKKIKTKAIARSINKLFNKEKNAQKKVQNRKFSCLINIFVALIFFLLLSTKVNANEEIEKIYLAPDRTNNLEALQKGARLFMNYCVSCHSLSQLRYDSLVKLGLSPKQIKENLLFTSDKIGDSIKNSMQKKDAKEWFGAAPPDLSLIVRASQSKGGNGANYVYTYLKSFYQDETKEIGWNNLAFKDAAMPNVLWELEGIKKAIFEEVVDKHAPTKKIRKFVRFETVVPGKMSAQEFDEEMANLVAFLSWAAEPHKRDRIRIGVWVILFLSIMSLILWKLNNIYWKNIKK